MRQYELDYYISAVDSNEIQHHGILGQKWGVKNGPPYPIRPRAIAKDPNAGETVAKGTTLYRISGRKSDMDNSVMYVTYKKYDRAYYKAAWRGIAKDKDNFGDGEHVYEQKMKLKEDLKIPSLNERDSIYKKVVSTNYNDVVDGLCVRYLTDVYKLYYSSQQIKDAFYKDKPLPHMTSKETKEWVKAWKDASSRDRDMADKLEDTPYHACWAIQYNPKLMDAVKKETIKRGYNVIYDDYSNYTSGKNPNKLVRMNDSALILINPKKQVEYLGATEVSEEESKRAAKEYREWQNGKRSEIKNTPLSFRQKYGDS